MQNLHLDQRDWQNILDRIWQSGNTLKVTIEIDREDMGSQKQVENATLDGLSYDHKGNTIAIRAGAVEHMIGKPERIEIAHDAGNLVCIEITGGDKTRHLITFIPPLRLPDILPARR